MTTSMKFIAVSCALTGIDLRNVILPSDLEILSRRFLLAAESFDAAGTKRLLLLADENTDFSSEPTDLEQLIVGLWYTGIGFADVSELNEEDDLAVAALSFRNALLWNVYGFPAKGIPKPYKPSDPATS